MGIKTKRDPFRLLVISICALLSLGFIVLWLLLHPDSTLWNEKGRVNIFVKSKPSFILSFNQQDNSLNVVSLPAKTTVDATGGYGNYLLEKIPKLDALEKKHGQLIVNSAGELLGIHIDGYLDLFDKEFTKSNFFNRDEFFQIKPEILNWQSVLKNFNSTGKNNSNLPVQDLLESFRKFRSINGGKMQFIDLAGSNIVSVKEIPDGSEVLSTESEVLDKDLGNFFNEAGVVDERLKGEVLNSTGEPGLAEKGARIITNLGGQVVNTANFNQKIDQCRIYTSQKFAKSFTVIKLSKIFSCEIRTQQLPESRSDYSLVLGFDYRKMLLGNNN